MTANHVSTIRRLLGVSLLSLAGCSELYVMYERVETTDGGREPAGAGCMMVLTGSDGALQHGGGLLGPDGDFTVREGERDGRFEVVITSQGEELSRRAYTEKFLLSHKRDTYTVTTVAGRTFEQTYWGGDECVSPRSE